MPWAAIYCDAVSNSSALQSATRSCKRQAWSTITSSRVRDTGNSEANVCRN